MADALPINSRIVIPAADLSYEFSRASGPGGQHVNTTDTRVRLRFDLAGCTALSPSIKARLAERAGTSLTDDGELLLTCDEHRSQRRNIDAVRERLAAMIQASLAPPKARRATRPTRASQKRRVEGKKQRGAVKAGRGKIDSD